MPAKTLLLFDIDGTLVYSNKIDSQCFATTFESIYGRPFPSIDWRVYPHVTDHTIFNTVIREQFQRAVEPGEIPHFQQQFVDLLLQKRNSNPEEFKEVPGAKAIIDRLMMEEQFTVGIATGGWERPARLKLQHVGIPEHRLVLSAADEQVRREDILQKAINQTRAQHPGLERVVYLGDASWDVRTTRNMGIDFIGIRLQGDLEVLQNLGAEVVLRDYRDYEALLAAVAAARVPVG